MMFCLHDEGAPKGGLSPRRREPGESHWRVIVPERPTVIEAVAFAKDPRGDVSQNAANVIEVFDMTAKSRGTV
jgi:hypothetical protein